jgi:hypothetical protein
MDFLFRVNLLQQLNCLAQAWSNTASCHNDNIYKRHSETKSTTDSRRTTINNLKKNTNNDSLRSTYVRKYFNNDIRIRPITILLWTICNLFDQKLELDNSKTNNPPTSDNRSIDKFLVEWYAKVSAIVSEELFKTWQKIANYCRDNFRLQRLIAEIAKILKMSLFESTWKTVLKM